MPTVAGLVGLQPPHVQGGKSKRRKPAGSRTHRTGKKEKMAHLEMQGEGGAHAKVAARTGRSPCRREDGEFCQSWERSGEKGMCKTPL